MAFQTAERFQNTFHDSWYSEQSDFLVNALSLILLVASDFGRVIIAWEWLVSWTDDTLWYTQPW